MSEKKRKVLQPLYMKDFYCIGSACEDTCCKGWRVDLDKETYLKYKKVVNLELKDKMKKYVKRKHNQKSDGSYGQIKMENNACPFLDDKLLCDIYKNLGEEYLSNTCTFYPRTTNRVDREYERSATVSCPEITRKVLLNPEGIEFEYFEEPIEVKVNISRILETKGHKYINSPQKYFWELRIFSIGLIQNRKYSLGDRLTILGMTYKKIAELEENNRIDEIPTIIENMTRMIEVEGFNSELEKLPANLNIQMRLAKEMTDIKLLQGISSKRYLDCVSETLIGLKYEKNEKLENVIENYNKSYEEYLKPYLSEKEYILENYLVNEFFREMMPFGSFKSIWDSYVFLCILYSMVKLHLIGMAGFYKGMDDEKTIKLIQSFSKIVLHNQGYIQNIVRLIKENEYDTLGYMSILVRN